MLEQLALNNTHAISSAAAMDNVVATAVLIGVPSKKHKIIGVYADYSATVSAVKSVQLSAGTIADDDIITATVLAIGSTDTNVSSTAMEYVIGRAAYAKAAVAAGTALAAGTIPQDKWGIYLFSINAAGTIVSTAGAANFTTGYDDEAAAIVALPATPASSVSMGYVTVLTKSGAAFIGGTDALQGGAAGNVSSDTNYYPTAAVTLSALDGMAPFRWDFSNGPFYLNLATPLHGVVGNSVVATLAASGAGGTTGRVSLLAF